MTNLENQKARNNEKWKASEQAGRDLSSEMLWCEYCHQGSADSIGELGCTASQSERDKNCLCAKAYNRMKRTKQ